MPELPEVETICRGLSPAMQNHAITAIEVRNGNLRIPVPGTLAEDFTDAVIQKIRRRSKYILIDCNNGKTILCHLGMSGRMTITANSDTPLKKHDHIIFSIQSGQQVIFNDPRRFGIVLGITTKDLASHPLIKNLGVEPLSDDFNAKAFEQIVKNKKGSIKNTIMNAKYVVGIGNIYASESLFRAGVLPTRKAGSLNKKECASLVAAIKETLKDAIEAGGSTLRDYVASDGELGYFQHQFLVYNRQGKPCITCKQSIQKEVMAGRSTYFCKQCQV